MTAIVDHPEATQRPETTRPSRVPWFKRPTWNRFTPLQLIVLGLATIAPLLVVGAIGAAAIGAITIETMLNLALAAGENPGMVVFGAMFLASPVQWFTGRSQIRVRKYLGIVFFLLALSNGAMFVVESGLGAALGAPFLIAGTVALVLATPLALTSSRWSQRSIGMKNWRKLHTLTYVVAVALLAHVVLVGDVGLGSAMISLGFIARIPAIRRWLARSGASRRLAANPE